MADDLPGAAGDLQRDYPDVWKSYADLGETTAACGPLSARERRLVKLALAIGAGSEGAVHSHMRRAEGDQVSRDDAMQVAMMSIGTLGFPRAVAAKTWIEDVTG